VSESDLSRILALDLHPRSFGFVVFEGEGILVDWGVRSFRRGVNAVQMPLGPKAAQLLDQYLPEMVVVKRPRTAKLRMIVNKIRKQAKPQRVPVRVLSHKAWMQFFAGENKHRIASRIAGRFPELLSILPPKRKPWQSEDYRMSIFDAAAVGIAFFEAHAEHPISRHTE
jgi:hypothetical protein